MRRPDLCAACGGDGRLSRTRALRPSGFAADPDRELTNAMDWVEWVPPPRALISCAGAPWVALGPALGRFRHAADGAVMAVSRGSARMVTPFACLVAVLSQSTCRRTRRHPCHWPWPGTRLCGVGATRYAVTAAPENAHSLSSATSPWAMRVGLRCSSCSLTVLLTRRPPTPLRSPSGKRSADAWASSETRSYAMPGLRPAPWARHGLSGCPTLPLAGPGTRGPREQICQTCCVQHERHWSAARRWCRDAGWWPDVGGAATFLPCRSSTMPPAAIASRAPATASRTGRRMRRACAAAATSRHGWTRRRWMVGRRRSGAHQVGSRAAPSWPSNSC